jgi:hypothetical protein
MEDGTAVEFPLPPSILPEVSFCTEASLGDFEKGGPEFKYTAYQFQKEINTMQTAIVFRDRYEDRPFGDRAPISYSHKIIAGCPAVRWVADRPDVPNFRLWVVEVVRGRVLHRLSAVAWSEDKAHVEKRIPEIERFLNSLEFRNPAIPREVAEQPLALDAGQLLDENKDPNDWTTRRSEYFGRSLDVTGIVKKISIENYVSDFRAQYLVIELDRTAPIESKSIIDKSVVCVLDDPEAWKKANIGAKITVRGKVQPPGVPSYSAILLTNCQVTTPGAPCVEVTTKELAGQVLKDRDAFDAKYGESKLAITGRVTKRFEKDKGDPLWIGTAFAFESVKGVEVLVVRPGGLDTWKPVKAGDTVTMLGSVATFRNGPSGLTIRADGEVIPKSVGTEFITPPTQNQSATSTKNRPKTSGKGGKR